MFVNKSRLYSKNPPEELMRRMGVLCVMAWLWLGLDQPQSCWAMGKGSKMKRPVWLGPNILLERHRLESNNQQEALHKGA